MTARVQTSVLQGFQATPVTIEVDTNRNLPVIIIVGLANKSIDESKERIRSAINNSGLQMPKRKITINMAPADLPKEGSSFDLAMALAILLKSQQIPAKFLDGCSVIGELGLDGSLRPVRGIIGHVLAAREMGCTELILPQANVAQAQLVENITLMPFQTLRQLYNHANGVKKHEFKVTPLETAKPRCPLDFSHIVGQQGAKRALEIAAAGGHNVLLDGAPGGGKTMLSKALVSILPPLEAKDIITLTQLYSLVSSRHSKTVTTRPFRSPHHSASSVSIIGGGQKPLPGEISLAHCGVLFLDEIAEFPRHVLEALRQPLEDNEITISRAQSTVTFPARCMLVATRNPCPCGFANDPQKTCSCSLSQLLNYQKKLSGPLLDRIDINVTVPRTKYDKLLADNAAESSREIAGRVARARAIQLARQGKTNASLSSADIKKFSGLSQNAQQLLENGAKKLLLSARGFMRSIKVARTIADLDEKKTILPAHIAEALQYRQVESNSLLS